MYDVTVPMALVDYVPVFLFGWTAVLLQRDFYGKMPKYAFACFAAGTINIFIAGFLKATWKLLYGADPEYQAYVKSVPILLPFVPLYSVEKYKWLVA